MSVKENRELFNYPDRIKEAFVNTKGITFKDGTIATSDEIWRFMTEETPRRFPHSFDLSLSNRGRISEDVDFFQVLSELGFRLRLKIEPFKRMTRESP